MKTRCEVLGFAFCCLLAAFILEVAVERHATIHVSMRDGSLVYKEFISFPSWADRAQEWEVYCRRVDTVNSQYLKLHVQLPPLETERLARLSTRVRGLVLGRELYTLHGDFSRLYLISYPDSDMVMRFFEHYGEKHPEFPRELQSYFSSARDNSESEFARRMNEVFADWLEGQQPTSHPAAKQ